MLQLYIANKNYSTWSLRPWILMKELGIQFDEHLTPFGTTENGQSQFLAFSPSGRVPCLHDGDCVVWDSLAIMEYLAESYAGVWPADKSARAWARSAAAEMHSGFQHIRNACSMNCGIRVDLFEWPPALVDEWRRVDGLWCEGISRFGGPFLTGKQFGAVDAFFAPLAFRVQTYAPELSSAASDYVERMLDLKHMKAWYASALTEVWRDEQHDREVLKVGTIRQDFRL